MELSDIRKEIDEIDSQLFADVMRRDKGGVFPHDAPDIVGRVVVIVCMRDEDAGGIAHIGQQIEGVHINHAFLLQANPRLSELFLSAQQSHLV